MAKVFISHVMYSTGLGTFTILFTLVNGNVYQGNVLTPTPSTPMTTMAQLKAFVTSAMLTYSQQQNLGLTTADIMFPDWTLGIGNAPLPAIADVLTNAKTDYNALDLLMSDDVATALNATNTRLNQVATQNNAILAALRTLGFVTP